MTNPSASTERVDVLNPWPGLAAYEEKDQNFFQGRDGEIAELLRLVKRDVLTTLYGHSGLGKTSLLQAGLFPLLREADMLPVYIRLKHEDTVPTPAEQVYSAIVSECEKYGIEAPVPRVGDTLWEYFYRSGSDFWSARHKVITPVLVFDQFEEIFTLGRATGVRRERGGRFLAQLADLVEMRVPHGVSEKMEGENPEQFNFQKPACKVLLSLREDYLSELESMRRSMPSLIHNRQRIELMKASNALDAVLKPGKGIVDAQVAKAIVHFVAAPRSDDDSENLDNIRVEPPLLSLVCRELNTRRIKQGLSSFTTDLLQGNQAKIVSEFFERCLQDQPEKVRQIIEDRLVTSTGFRDSMAVVQAVEIGLPRSSIDMLVTRRLLRLDERWGVQRVELTHDVLIAPIIHSRDERRRQEQIAKFKQRELEQSKRLRKLSLIGTALFAVALVMVALTLFALEQSKKAKKSAEEAKKSAAEAKAARGIAEANVRGLMLWQQAKSLHADKDDVAARFVAASAIGYKGWMPSDPSPEINAFIQSQTEYFKADDPVKREIDQFILNKTGSLMWSHESAGSEALTKVDDPEKYIAVVTVSNDNDAPVDYVIRFKMPDGQWTVPAIKTVQSATTDISSSKGAIEAAISYRSEQGDVSKKLEVLHAPMNKVPLTRKDGIGYKFALDAKNSLVLQKVDRAVPSITVAISPDGFLLAAGCDDNQIRIWDVATGVEKQIFQGHLDRISAIDFSPDQQWLVSASFDQSICLWNLKKGGAPVFVTKGAGRIASVRFSPDGALLASAHSDNTVRLWDIQSRKELTVFKQGHIKQVSAVCFSPDQKTLASAGADCRICLWNIKTGDLKATMNGHTDWVSSVAFSPDGARLASGSADRTIKLWDLKTLEPKEIPNASRDIVQSVLFFNHGQGLLWGSAAGTIHTIDIDSLVATSFQAHLAGVTSLALAPDGHTVASGSLDSKIRLWALPGQEELARINGPNSVSNLSVSCDQSALAASVGSRVEVWDCLSGKRLTEDLEHSYVVKCLAFSPVERKLAFAGMGDEIRTWDADSGARGRYKVGGSAIHSVAFSDSGKSVIAGCEDGATRILDLDSGSVSAEYLLEKPIAFTYPVQRPVILSAVPVQRLLQFWDYNLKAGVDSIECDFSPGCYAQSSSKQQHLLAIGGKNKIHIFDVTSKSVIAKVRKPIVVIIDPSEKMKQVTALSFSPDRSALVSASEDGIVRFWSLNYQTGKAELLSNLDACTGKLQAVIFISDSVVATASDCRHIQFWNVPQREDLISQRRFRDCAAGNLEFPVKAKTQANMPVGPERSYVSILQSRRSENEKNLALFESFCWARSKNAASLIFSRLADEQSKEFKRRSASLLDQGPAKE